MTLTAIPTIIFAYSTLIAQEQLPDELDLLRTVNRKPQVALLLDHSCSMRNGQQITPCVYYAVNHNGGATNLTLNKNEMMKAALTGCSSDSDGVLDKWSETVNFSVMQFPTRGLPYGVRAPFDSQHSTLENAVQGVGIRGNTPITQGLKYASEYFNAYFNDGNSLSCRPNYVVLLSDGNPNGGSATFDSACDPSVSTRTVGARQPWNGANYLANSGDLLCSVDGDQNIETYAIGFGAPGSFNESNLQRVANEGGGSYHYASDVNGLDEAFSTIIQDIVDRSAIFFSSPAVQREGIFTGNYMYVSSYRPETDGLWKGNLKKICIYPQKLANGIDYDPSDLSCMFRYNAAEEKLFTNPNVIDQWLPNTSTTTSDVGGAGRVMLCGSNGSGCSDGLGLPGEAPNTPYRSRNILTWRNGTSEYVPVQLGGANEWTTEDAWTSGGAHASLLNYLHGYTFEANPSNGNPLAVRDWPIGDIVHTPTTLLKFGDCEQKNNCWVVTAANDGMLHFFDSFDGEETSALIPAELWKPNGVAKNTMASVIDQPSSEVNHRYYLDGGARLYHRDDDADGFIDEDERASLIFGLGRGGKAYYAIDVAQLQIANGRLSNARTPIRSIQWADSGEFTELQETWASPWVGQMLPVNATSPTAAPLDVAIFPSGHIAEHDNPGFRLPGQTTDSRFATTTPVQMSCPQASAALGLPPFCGFTGSSSDGYPDPIPLDFTTGTFAFENAIAYRIRFSTFDIDSNDAVVIQSGQGMAAASLTSSGIAADAWSDGLDADGWSPWVYADSLQVRMLTDGNATNNRGFVIGQIEYLEADTPPRRDHSPTVYIVDLEAWRQPNNSFADRLSNSPIVARFTRDCNDGQNCFDATNVRRRDLRHMTCAISAEISVYTVGEKARMLYWPDECGQIFKAWHDGTTWNVVRLLYTNNTPNMVTLGQGEARDFRKMFSRLDLVPSTCTGRKSVGVYFGTGNAQRPTSVDELSQAPAVTTPASDRDIVGVIWDDTSVQNVDLNSLADVSSIAEYSPVGSPQLGWFWRLGDNEKSLRRPIVFKGTTFWKTYQPTQEAAECQAAAGIDRVYAVNNCTAKAIVDQQGKNDIEDREIWRQATDIGSELLVVSPKDGPAMVTHANLASSEAADLTPNKGIRKIPFIYHWRIPRED